MNKNMRNFPALFMILGMLTQALITETSESFGFWWSLIPYFIMFSIFVLCLYWYDKAMHDALHEQGEKDDGRM